MGLSKDAIEGFIYGSQISVTDSYLASVGRSLDFNDPAHIHMFSESIKPAFDLFGLKFSIDRLTQFISIIKETEMVYKDMCNKDDTDTPTELT